MRTSRRSIHWILIGCALLMGCGASSGMDADGDEDGHPPAEMVGDWNFQSATVNSVSTPLADALDWEPATTHAKLHVQANGGYQYEELNSAGAQVWAEGGWIFVDPEGGTIVIHSQYDSDGANTDEVTVEYTLAGGTLTLTVVEFADTSVYTLTK